MFTTSNNNLIMVCKHPNVQIGYSISGTSSIDTTCTIWGLETSQVIGRVPHMVTGQVKTQLIAHDKEVYDIAFSKGKFWWIKMNHIGNQITNCIIPFRPLLLYQVSNYYNILFFLYIAGGGRDMFASVGADGSVRMFDLRHLEHSTIIYEDPQHTPLLR